MTCVLLWHACCCDMMCDHMSVWLGARAWERLTSVSHQAQRWTRVTRWAWRYRSGDHSCSEGFRNFCETASTVRDAASRDASTQRPTFSRPWGLSVREREVCVCVWVSMMQWRTDKGVFSLLHPMWAGDTSRPQWHLWVQSRWDVEWTVSFYKKLKLGKLEFCSVSSICFIKFFSFSTLTYNTATMKEAWFGLVSDGNWSCPL